MSDGADKLVAKWDPDLTRRIAGRVGPLIKRYFRAEVRDVARVPAAGGALVASNRIGSDVLLLNTSFAGPALAEVVEREGTDTVIYHEEFTAIVSRALEGRHDTTRILGWTDRKDDPLTVDNLIESHAGQRSRPSERKSDIILLTSGTTGTPKGAKRSAGSGGAGDLKAVLDRTPRDAARHLRPTASPFRSPAGVRRTRASPARSRPLRAFRRPEARAHRGTRRADRARRTCGPRW